MVNRRLHAIASLGVLLLAFVLRLVHLAESLLLPDEAYYWLWSRHLDLAYYDHPAGVALLLRVSTALGGQGAFGIRWLNALLGTAVVALTIAIAQQVIAPKKGLWAGTLVAVGAPFLVTSRFVYTDTLFLFFMLLNLWCFLELPGVSPRRINTSTEVNPDERHSPRCHFTYVLFGLTLAWLFNTKYTAYLYSAALAGWLLVERRNLLRDVRFWIAVGTAGAGLVPVLVWNAAHGWASFRWQFAHTLSASPGAARQTALLGQWLTNVRHAVAYHSWPLTVSAIVGALALTHLPRKAGSRLVIWLGLVLGLPPLLSPANSPRNLIGGLLLLVLSAEAWIPDWIVKRRALVALAICMITLTALYGTGTVLVTNNPLHSSASVEIQRETADLPFLVNIATNQPQNNLLAIDYSIAGQLWYYTGRAVATGWRQYRLWDHPILDPVTVISLGYLPDTFIDAHLRALYTAVEGPYPVTDTQRPCMWWRAHGLRKDEEEVLTRLDFLTLWEALR